MNHAERYESLITKLSSMRWRGGELDCSYQAALYLMASHPVLAEKVERYFSPFAIKKEVKRAWMAGEGIREISKGVAAHLLFQEKRLRAASAVIFIQS